ncbi:unnamed protein product [Cochlearia groenlandica]
MSEKKQHFVLVHGPSHGAWYWHKVKPILEASGHRVTALNLTASGINVTKSITQVFSCEQYTEPLLEFMRKLQSDEKVVLLSHSTGGISASIAMEKFPDKISFKRETPDEAWLGSEFVPYGTDGVSMSLSYEFLKQAMYNLCSVEDLELTLLTKRPGSLFINELLKADNFTEKGYGSVPRAYIVNKEDLATTETYQRWMIDNYPPSLVVEMDKADHIPMFSNPQLLSTRLMEIATKFP